MPELPDLTVYLEALQRRVLGEVLEGIRIVSPFVLRTVDPAKETLAGRRVQHLTRIGKQILLTLEEDHFIVLHLMISGRLHWKKARAAIPKRNGLAAFDFASGSLILTESSRKKRAALYLLEDREALAVLDRGGLEPLTSDAENFRTALQARNHTLKRALTDPAVFAGIGNAYSDEILHAARLSPFKQTQALSADEIQRLHRATVQTLSHWTDRLRLECGDGFPEKVTAFRAGMAVHGRYAEPCPVCGAPVQRIVYAENEANYCAKCQTGGKLLADRALSRLLKSNWPKTLEALERDAG
ncbi:MAG: DNA-formamidopyrimidine glycosylase family protein [Pseudomonadota bacterium]|nr:DNA-formamidopyrimidine glycosylase family protein [Pseudomonadota bacterium]